MVGIQCSHEGAEHSKLLDSTMAGRNAKTVAELLQRSKAMREEQRPL